MHVIRVVRGQPYRGTADFFGLADPLIRDELHELAVGGRCVPGLHVDRRANCAWTDRIDSDPVRSDLLCQALHHQHDAALGGRIVHVARPGDHFMFRADSLFLSCLFLSLFSSSSLLSFSPSFPLPSFFSLSFLSLSSLLLPPPPLPPS